MPILSYKILDSFKKSEKTNEPFLNKTVNRQIAGGTTG